jgi:hypothetical protein
MTRLTKNFHLEEFERSATAAEHGIDNRMPSKYHAKAQCLSEYLLQPMRDGWSRLDVSSGYRCEELNALIGGAKESQHLRMEAADISGHGKSTRNLSVWAALHMPIYDQIIYEHRHDDEGMLHTWVHVSLRMQFSQTLGKYIPSGDNRKEHLIKIDNEPYRAFDYLKDTL